MASIIWLKSFPARPTNGRPCASSSAPGPSPTKTSCAAALPSPKTILLRVVCSLQRVHTPRSARTTGSVSPEIRLVVAKRSGAAGATGNEGNLAADAGAADFGAAFGTVNSSLEMDVVSTGEDATRGVAVPRLR